MLNPFARVDFPSKLWICPFCHMRNHFPPHYASISETNLPAELFPNYCTVEYTMQQRTTEPPAYLLVIDTALAEDELEGLKTALGQALSLMPENAQVGIITFGTHVHVHELGCLACVKSYVFKGTMSLKAQLIKEKLQLLYPVKQSQIGANGTHVPTGAGRFFLPVSEYEFQLSAMIDELYSDPFPDVSDQRSSRCTGTALQVAASLMGSCFPNSYGRLMLFVGGPSTVGPGAIVSRDLTEPIRSHKDISKSTQNFNKSKLHYSLVAEEIASSGHTVDVFACALEQVGLAEMKPCVEMTGGLVVLAESFHHNVFRESLSRIFQTEGDDDLHFRSNCTLEVLPSHDVKVCGVVGPCSPLARKTQAVSDTIIGMGETTAWRVGSLIGSTTLACYFDVATLSRESNNAQMGTGVQQFFIQFVCKSQLPSGERRCRVTTVTRRWTEGKNLPDLAAGFDQEAAAVAVARLSSFKMEMQDEFDATRWLDRALIKLSSRFGDYRKDDPSSFQLSPQFSIFPQFMFNLRRSQFVQVFNNSPDETAYFRIALNRETTTNALVMIQPTLMSYSFSGPPEPVLLDVASIVPDRILLLDSYFTVVIFHGTTVAQWRKAGYQDMPEHESFKQLLEAPQADADAIIHERFPAPRRVDCDQNGSQARFLLAKLNPSATYNSSGVGIGGTEVILTDDVSLQVFMEHLQKLAVES